jgi:hypothetical protein
MPNAQTTNPKPVPSLMERSTKMAKEPDPATGFLAQAMEQVRKLGVKHRTQAPAADPLDVARGKIAAGETLSEQEFNLVNEAAKEGVVPAKVQMSAVLGESETDNVNHPKHYTSHPSGVECITITEYMGFNVGNAVKYLWRVGHKIDDLEDLKKARWYIDREIAKREGTTST